MQGLNLRTAEGSGGAQRKQPSGQDDVLVGVAPDAREVVLDANDGRVLLKLATDEKVVGLDNFYAIVRGANKRSVRAVGLGRNAVLWRRDVRSGARVALTRHAVLILERDPDKLTAVDPETGQEMLSRRTEAKVLAASLDGLILADGRDFGFVPFATAAAAPGDQPTEPVGREPVGPARAGP